MNSNLLKKDGLVMNSINETKTSLCETAVVLDCTGIVFGPSWF